MGQLRLKTREKGLNEAREEPFDGAFFRKLSVKCGEWNDATADSNVSELMGNFNSLPIRRVSLFEGMN